MSKIENPLDDLEIVEYIAYTSKYTAIVIFSGVKSYLLTQKIRPTKVGLGDRRLAMCID